MKIVIIILLIVVIIALSACYSRQAEPKTSDIPLLINATQFSKISVDDLITIMGEPDEIDEWNDKIDSVRAYKVTTYCYQVDDVSYEFSFINELLTYMIAQSHDFGIGINSDVFPRFGIVPKRNNPTGKSGPLFARWTILNDDIAGVWVQGKDGIANWVKITYDVQYEMNKQ